MFAARVKWLGLIFIGHLALASSSQLQDWSWRKCPSADLCFELKGEKAETSYVLPKLYARNVRLTRLTKSKIDRQIAAERAEWSPRDEKWILYDVRAQGKLIDVLVYPDRNKFVRIQKVAKP